VVPVHHYREYPTPLSLSDFPTAYGYLSASLKQAGHEVIGVNLNNITGYATSCDMIRDQIRAALQWKPDLIGTGGLCIDYAFIKDAMGIFRELAPDTPIVLGGGIINNDAEFIFNLFKPDFCIIGEGEERTAQLADMLGEGGQDFDKINNLGYWKDGVATFTELNYDYGKLDDRPFPDWETFGIKNMLDNFSMSTRALYRQPRPYSRPMIIVTARSCPFKCTFCVHNHGAKYRVHSVGRIMREIEAMYDQYGFNILIIQDELFAVNKKRMDEFCTTLIAKREEKGWDFSWMMQTHANANLDKESMELAKKAGCYMFSYGIESASPRVLESMNKKTKVSQIIKAIELANEVGIGFGGNLLFGDPAETEVTVYESLDFLARYGRASFIFLSPLSPYPGSTIFNNLMEAGVIKDKLEYYEKIDRQLFNMTTMSPDKWGKWFSFLMMLETSWLMVEQTDATRWEEDTCNDPIAKFAHALIYKIWAICPYCGEEIMYRQLTARPPNEENRFFLGFGCTNCNKKIRINVPHG